MLAHAVDDLQDLSSLLSSDVIVGGTSAEGDWRPNLVLVLSRCQSSEILHDLVVALAVKHQTCRPYSSSQDVVFRTQTVGDMIIFGKYGIDVESKKYAKHKHVGVSSYTCMYLEELLFLPSQADVKN